MRFWSRAKRFAEAATVLLAACILGGCSAGREVVVYAAQDQVYSEPILARFTKETGIAVRAVYDTEAVKAVGLANRLLAERTHPVCDLFWNNEELRVRQLEAEGIFRETKPWAAFGHRSRRIVVNTNLVTKTSGPIRFVDLTNSTWRGRVSMAYPLFGTTATHFLALRAAWGEATWLRWCEALAANEPFLEEGNSHVVKRVGRGDAWIGLTDSDDIAAGRREGLPIAALPMAEETLLIPNTVAVTRGGPNPAEADALFNYLQRTNIVRELVEAGALEGVELSGERGTLDPDWPAMLSSLEPATAQLKSIFLR